MTMGCVRVSATSVIIPISGTASLMALTARFNKLFWSYAAAASSDFWSCGTTGKRAIAGIPMLLASRTCLIKASILWAVDFIHGLYRF